MRPESGLLSGLLLLTLCVPGVLAQDTALRAPIESRNLSPLYANLGIPVLQDAAGLERGHWSVGWSVHWASHALREGDSFLALELDGETRRHDLRLSAGLGNGVTVFANLPWVSHGGGALDSLIDGWHDFWGMPDGPRPEQPRDALRFAYGGAPGFLLDDSASGTGDLEFGASIALLRRESLTLAAFAQAKLDTGDARDFTGSGDSGYSAGLRVSSANCVWATLSCHLQLGVSDVGTIAYAPDADNRVVFGALALAWGIRENLAVLAQLDVHGTMYSGGALSDSGTPVWGTLGLRWEPAKRWLLEAHFGEDLQVGAAPDITFLMGLKHRF